MGNVKMETSQKKGTVIIIATLTLGILLLLGLYFLSFTLTESRISKSQTVATQTYYLAEAGVYEAMWKLKNDEIFTDDDDPWKINFTTSTYEDCETWSDSFSRSNVLFEGGSYTVTIQNSACGRGQIIATATTSLPAGKTAQRIIKTEVFKTIGNPIEDIVVFSGGRGKKDELKIKKSIISFYDGNLFSNSKIKIEKQSEVEVFDNSTTSESEGQILAVKKFELKRDSTATATAIHAENYPPAPDLMLMPQVDFDSEATSSYKSQAQTNEDADQCSALCNGLLCMCNGSPCPGGEKCVLKSSEFEDLLWTVGEGGTLTLNNDITYVKGSVRLRGNRSLIINGVLVADKNIEIGKKYTWKREDEEQEGYNQLIINNVEGEASGLLAKRKIEFGKYSSLQDTTSTGLLYAIDDIKFKSIPNSLTVEGGIIGKKVKFESLWQGTNVYLDNSIVATTLGEAAFSPVINIEHWEEAY